MSTSAFTPPPSPVTGGTTTISDHCDPKVIISRYADSGFDVRRYFEGLESINILCCRDTGYRFFYPPSVAGESDFYSEIYSGGADDSYRIWSDDYQFALDRLEPGEDLLDVGCGFGKFLARASKVVNAIGLDGNTHAAEEGAKAGLSIVSGSISDYAKSHPAEFDTVTAFQLIEHIYNIADFLRDALSLLKPDGRLIIAVPNNEPYIRRFDKYNTWNTPPHHIGLWNEASLRSLSGFFPLDVEEVAFQETSSRWMVDAHLRSSRWLGVTADYARQTSIDRAKAALGMPLAMPLSLFDYVRTPGPLTRNVISVIFRKRSCI